MFAPAPRRDMPVPPCSRSRGPSQEVRCPLHAQNGRGERCGRNYGWACLLFSADAILSPFTTLKGARAAPIPSCKARGCSLRWHISTSFVRARCT